MVARMIVFPRYEDPAREESQAFYILLWHFGYLGVSVILVPVFL